MVRKLNLRGPIALSDLDSEISQKRCQICLCSLFLVKTVKTWSVSHSKNASLYTFQTIELQSQQQSQPITAPGGTGWKGAKQRGNGAIIDKSLKSDEKFIKVQSNFILSTQSNIIKGIQLLNLVLCGVLWWKTHVGGLGPRTENG